MTRYKMFLGLDHSYYTVNKNIKKSSSLHQNGDDDVSAEDIRIAAQSFVEFVFSNWFTPLGACTCGLFGGALPHLMSNEWSDNTEVLWALSALMCTVYVVVGIVYTVAFRALWFLVFNNVGKFVQIQLFDQSQMASSVFVKTFMSIAVLVGAVGSLALFAVLLSVFPVIGNDFLLLVCGALLLFVLTVLLLPLVPIYANLDLQKQELLTRVNKQMQRKIYAAIGAIEEDHYEQSKQLDTQVKQASDLAQLAKSVYTLPAGYHAIEVALVAIVVMLAPFITSEIWDAIKSN